MAKRNPDSEAYVQYRDVKIPVAIYFERRRNTRISIGADRIHLRLSDHLSKDELQDQVQWAEKWLSKRFDKAPALLERFKVILFEHGDRIRIMTDTFVLHIDERTSNRSKAKLHGADIFLQLQTEISEKNRTKTVQNLLHKIFCLRYLSYFENRIKHLNNIHFNAPYNSVKLKYIHSKWGSCSHDGKIILSSKLLLCPTWIQDYVLIHELAHLIELNHSDAFWQLVEDAFPDYERAENWLDDIGSGLEIKPIRIAETPLPRMKIPSNDSEASTIGTVNNSKKKLSQAHPAPDVSDMIQKSKVDAHGGNKSNNESEGKQLTLF